MDDLKTNFDDRTTFRLAGIVSNLQIKYTRKDSRQMAVFNLATRTQNYELIMFPDPYEKNGAMLENGKLALIHGITNRREGEMSLTAHEVYDLEKSIPRIIERINFILQPKHRVSQIPRTLARHHRRGVHGQQARLDRTCTYLRSRRQLPDR